MPKPVVIIESPYAGDVARNVMYARSALADSILRDECPIAGHLLYTQVLDDTIPAMREQGIALHMRWLDFVDLMAVYVDFGISPGMQRAIDVARARRIPITFRTIN